MRRCWRTGHSPTCWNLTAPSASPIIRHRARRRRSRPASTGSPSRNCASAPPGQKVSALRRSASCSGRSRASTSSSTIRARRISTPRRRRTSRTMRRCGRTALPPAFLPAEAINRRTRRSRSRRRQRGTGSGNVEELGPGRCVQSVFLPRFSVEANWYKIKIDGAIQPVDAEFTVTQCVVNNDPARLRPGYPFGRRPADPGCRPARQYRRHRNRRASTSTCSIRQRISGLGRFGFTWNNTFLLDYDVIVPTATAKQAISREGTEQGSPSQGFPPGSRSASSIGTCVTSALP